MNDSNASSANSGMNRRVYSAPSLEAYGSMIELTATGSTQKANESNSGKKCLSSLAAMAGACGNP